GSIIGSSKCTTDECDLHSVEVLWTCCVLYGRRYKKRLLLLTAMVVLWTGGSRAEMWCGRSPSAPLDHPCDAAAKTALSAAVLRYRNEWMALGGIREVELITSQNGGDEILVRVDLHFADPPRSQIPASVDSVPVVILPGAPPGPETAPVWGEGSGPGAPETAEEDQVRRQSELKEREAAEKAYSLTVHKYGKRWLALPGVIGIGPSKCDRDGCDFGSVGIAVQRQFLDVTRNKIPRSVNGVATVLIPQD
ncbi:MAG: hypothetical protein WA854_16375, partial [Candidatus Binataceae bacterium]